MSHLSKRDRFLVLEMVTEIASEAAKNANIAKMVEFQEQLVESLYRKMTTLLEEDLERAAEEDYDDEYDEEDEEDEDDDLEPVEDDDGDAIGEPDEVEEIAREKRTRRGD